MKKILRKLKINYAKTMFKTLGKVLPACGFRWLRVHWARMISKNIDKKANIQKGSYISGNGNGLTIGYRGAIGINCQVGSDLTIGSGTMMGPNCLILTQNHFFDHSKKELDGYISKKVVIGEKCWIGARVIILPGAEIGNHCIVGAGSVVPGKLFPDYSLIAGNPAKVKKSLLK